MDIHICRRIIPGMYDGPKLHTYMYECQRYRRLGISLMLVIQESTCHRNDGNVFYIERPKNELQIGSKEMTQINGSNLI